MELPNAVQEEMYSYVRLNPFASTEDTILYVIRAALNDLMALAEEFISDPGNGVEEGTQEEFITLLREYIDDNYK